MDDLNIGIIIKVTFILSYKSIVLYRNFVDKILNSNLQEKTSVVSKSV